MKRSEAVKIIARALRVWNGAFYDDSLESYILGELENAGMVPPAQEIVVASGSILHYYVEDGVEVADILSTIDSIDKTNSHILWEPEDENNDS
jgi:hypothetical protein